jgi:hypothetical protein
MFVILAALRTSYAARYTPKEACPCYDARHHRKELPVANRAPPIRVPQIAVTADTRWSAMCSCAMSDTDRQHTPEQY